MPARIACFCAALLLAGCAATTGAPESHRTGLYLYMADAAIFDDCATGTRMPVAQEGDSAALERAYLARRSVPGVPLLATVEGRVLMRQPQEGPQRMMLVVDRLVEVTGRTDCGAAARTMPLENTYWKLVTLRGQPVEAAPGRQEAHLILQTAQRRLVGSGGCNRMMGSYTLDGASLRLGNVAGTRMACPAGMEQEQAFLAALAQVARWRYEGPRLALLDAQGAVLALFESRLMQ